MKTAYNNDDAFILLTII